MSFQQSKHKTSSQLYVRHFYCYIIYWFKRFVNVWKVDFTLMHECTVKKLLVNICTIFFFLWPRICALFLLSLWAGIGGQSLVRNNRLLFSFWSPEQNCLWQTQGGRGDDLVVWCWLEKPKEEHRMCFNSFFSNPGSSWRRNQFEFRSPHLLLCLHPLLIFFQVHSQHHTWRGSHNNCRSRRGQCTVCGKPGLHGKQAGSRSRNLSKLWAITAQGSMRKAKSLSECWLFRVRRSGRRSSNFGKSVLSSGRRLVMRERRAFIRFSCSCSTAPTSTIPERSEERRRKCG